ncbi:MAG: ABC transporter ATP-binding protein [Candidatus Staskawiczbacteria bacterium]|jgi:ATP-binding cassette subfamily B protein
MAKEKIEKVKIQKNIIYPKVGVKEVFVAIWNGIKPQKWFLFIMVFSLALGNLTGVITPLFYKQFFDIIAVPSNASAVAQKLLVLIVYVLVLNFVGWIFYRISDFSVNVFEPSVMANLRQQSYEHMMLHSYSFFVNNFTGSLVQKVNRFARAFERLTDDLVGNLLPLSVRIIGILFIVFFINRWLDLLLFVWIIIFMAFNVFFSSWKVKYDIKSAEIDSKATGYLADTITNQNTIQFFNGYNFEKKGYRDVTNEQAKISSFSWNLNSILYAVQALLGVAIEFVLFFYAIKYWQQGLITIGVFVLLQAYVLNIIDQFWGFTRIVRDVYQSYADAKEMVEILNLPHEIQDKPQAKELVVKNGEIEFKDLTFAFNETRKVLNNINLDIKPGEKVALVGPSGAGKTTFVRLLLRLYSPTSGKILIDGQDISDATQESLRKNISMVPQDPILFHRTLAENIAYGRRGSSIGEIKKAAALAHCEEFIKDLPFGLETFVGERGIKLSGGERQRVAIARAILKNAPILILDEATSSLDSNSEMLIQDALNNLMQDKTVIVIAHRLSTIQKMDRIIVVDEGKIIEQGSHADLLKNEYSLYKKLWELQAGGFLKSESDEEEQDEDLEEDEEDDDEWEGKGEAKMVNF